MSSLPNINRMDVKTFRAFGYLHWLNLRLHPLGLAIEVIIDEETGEEQFGGIWDYRDDPEGIYYDAEDIESEKIARVEAEWEKRRPAREAALGFMTQATNI